jgi:glutamate/tyrosine decarboxylase-like PLP-dependent enzyme
MMDVSEFRAAGHKVVDRLAEYFESIESKAVFPDVDPKMISGLFDEPLPAGPESMEEVLAELEEKLLPYCTHVGHPGYMGLITPSPNPVGVIGDFICSAVNQNLGVYSIGRRRSRWSGAWCAG